MNELLEESIALWHETETSFPRFGRKFSEAEQSVREQHLSRFLKNIDSALFKLPRTKPERNETRERITSAFVEFGKSALELEDRHLELLLGREFSGVGTDLGREARRFDPDVSASDILQACRNTWAACGLQGLLGETMRLTPSIFAYSMLYPYSDNYLDDPAISREAKSGFNQRFGRRLSGDCVAPANDREAAIWRLVGLVEGQYARANYAAVFDSLLAIHRAQVESIRLLRGSAPIEGVDVLKLSFAKGGASVLADAYLAAGSLTTDEARFAFQWGILLQLGDDLQDLCQDRESGLRTLFSCAAGREPLDELTNRALSFAEKLMSRLDSIGVPGSGTLQELIRKSSRSLLIRSAIEADQFYTKEYLAELETYSPFRISFLARRRRGLAGRSGLHEKLFEVFLAAEEDEPVFPMLPGTIMPRY